MIKIADYVAEQNDSNNDGGVALYIHKSIN